MLILKYISWNTRIKTCVQKGRQILQIAARFINMKSNSLKPCNFTKNYASKIFPKSHKHIYKSTK